MYANNLCCGQYLFSFSASQLPSVLFQTSSYASRTGRSFTTYILSRLHPVQPRPRNCCKKSQQKSVQNGSRQSLIKTSFCTNIRCHFSAFLAYVSMHPPPLPCPLPTSLETPRHNTSSTTRITGLTCLVCSEAQA